MLKVLLPTGSLLLTLDENQSYSIRSYTSTDENVLKAYLEEREKKVTSIMIALFNEENIQKAYGKEKFDEGRAEGKDEQAKNSAIKMHELGMANSVIANIVGYAESVVASWITSAHA